MANGFEHLEAATRLVDSWPDWKKELAGIPIGSKMANPSDEETCKRYRVMIDEEHFYFVVGNNFVHATVPYENRPDRAQLRKVVDQVCKEITKILGGETTEC